MKWTKIEDGKPAVDEGVLVIWVGIDIRDQPVRYYNIAALTEDGSWVDEDGGDVDEPTHWMPLPEPPAIETTLVDVT